MKEQNKEDKIKQMFDNLDKGVKEVFSSENYENYLKTMSKFHNYSAKNVVLIFNQCPEASFIAGYKSWEKNFNRHVKRGEKGIQIIGFNPFTIESEEKVLDQTGKPVTNEKGEYITETVKTKIPSFKPLYVFDISQTEGEPLPSSVNRLSGGVSNYQSIMNALIDISPYPIEYQDIKTEGTNGYCDYKNEKIVLRHMMSEEQRIKTCIHEISHAILHVPPLEQNSETEIKSRNVKEIEAESSAYIICNYLGIDTSDYSFGYIANWSSDKELKQLHECLDTIQKHSMNVINEIDSYFEKEQTKDMDNQKSSIDSEIKEENNNEKSKNSIRNSRFNQQKSKNISKNKNKNEEMEI